ncbi:hypothetical protein HWV62_24672 [Athelia sp. TMB]|nr:hypothetical protein HWV62_24672 [Athelia sp. TMB]
MPMAIQCDPDTRQSMFYPFEAGSCAADACSSPTSSASQAAPTQQLSKYQFIFAPDSCIGHCLIINAPSSEIAPMTGASLTPHPLPRASPPEHQNPVREPILSIAEHHPGWLRPVVGTWFTGGSVKVENRKREHRSAITASKSSKSLRRPAKDNVVLSSARLPLQEIAISNTTLAPLERKASFNAPTYHSAGTKETGFVMIPPERLYGLLLRLRECDSSAPKLKSHMVRRVASHRISLRVAFADENLGCSNSKERDTVAVEVDSGAGNDVFL